jgi:putative NADH-flavin reductase
MHRSTHASPLKILLLGANGRTGRAFLDRASRAGDTVTAVVRAADRLADVRHPRVTVRVGSPCDPSVLVPLLPGHDVVVSVLGPRWPSKNAAAIYPDSAAAIVEAMQRSSVDRLLVTSSALLFPDDGFFVSALRWLVPNVVEGARRMEEHIRASNLDWTIARTSFLNDRSNTDCRVAAGSLPEAGGAVSRTAVARFLHSEAHEPTHQRRVVGLCG